MRHLGGADQQIGCKNARVLRVPRNGTSRIGYRAMRAPRSVSTLNPVSWWLPRNRRELSIC